MTFEAQVEKLKSALVAAHLREAARNAGVGEPVIDDILAYSSQFTVGSDCATVTHRDTGLAPADWLKARGDDRPHWFPQESKTEGAADFKENPWSATHWNITKQGKIMESSMPQAEAMAKAAGVDVMAAHPKKA